MALRELLLPWDAQPQEAARPSVDLGPDAILWSAVNPQLLLGAVDRIATEASGSTRPGPLGVARSWARAASAGALFGTFQHVQGLEITVACVAAPVAGTNRKIAWSQRTSGSNAAQFAFGFNIDGSTGVSAQSGGIGLVGRNTLASGGGVGSPSQFDGLPHAWVLANGASTGYVYRDGVAQTVSPNVRNSGTVWTSAQATAIGNIGDYTVDGSFVSDDPIYLVIVWPRVLPEELARDLSAVLARSLGPAFEPRRIWVPVSMGGGSWSVSLTETASASDSLGAATTALVSLIESASAADIIGAATIAAVALTEAASASDTQTASYSATGSGSVTESASASDTLDAATTMLRALTETASADDQLAAATTMLRAISESVSASDDASASYTGAGAAAITETASATDALTAAATLLVTILEAGNATDALAAATTMVRAITEQATAADEVAASQPIIASVSITELATAIDVLIGELAGGAWVAGDGLMSKPRIGMARNGEIYTLVVNEDGVPIFCRRQGKTALLKVHALPGGDHGRVMTEAGVVLVVM